MISVIIPTLDAGSILGRLLLSLSKQTTPMEVIVVDSSSTDHTVKVAQNYGVKVLTVNKNDFNHGQTRNIAARTSKSDVLVFMTQDSLPTDEYCLENLLKPLVNTQAIASFGRQIFNQDAAPTEQFARIFNYPGTPTIKWIDDLPKLGIKTFFFSNVCSAIKTKEFKELGCFPENVIMFEDLIFAAKAILNGYKIAYVPEAKVIHSHNFSLKQQFQRYLDAGISLRNNTWIFEHAKTNREGAKFLKQEIAYLSKNRQYQWIPYAIAESVFKFAGFWLGIHGMTSHRRLDGTLSSSNNFKNA
jgi:rhamnosyltransferase